MSYLFIPIVLIVIIFYELRIHKINKIKELDYIKFKKKFDETITDDLIQQELNRQIEYWKNKYERSRYNNRKLNIKVVQLNSKIREYEKS